MGNYPSLPTSPLPKLSCNNRRIVSFLILSFCYFESRNEITAGCNVIDLFDLLYCKLKQTESNSVLKVRQLSGLFANNRLIIMFISYNHVKTTLNHVKTNSITKAGQRHSVNSF